MCGIVAALPGYSSELDEVSGQQILEFLPDSQMPGAPIGNDGHREATAALDRLVKSLATATEVYSLATAGHLLVTDPELRRSVALRLAELDGWLDQYNQAIDLAAGSWDADLLESAQGLALKARDLVYALRYDRVGAAKRAAALCAGVAPDVAVSTSYLAVDAVLDAIDRLEVRGRDSAGVQIWVTLSDADRARIPATLAARQDPDYRHGAVDFFRGGVALVYKRASVIGRLGENVDFLRAAITDDDDLHALLRLPSARVAVLAHTRWASVGRISEANAHPVDSRCAAPARTTAMAVLNGDIDNHLKLRERLDLPIDPAGVSTDAKVIPVALARGVEASDGPATAMIRSVGEYDGSFAIVAQTDADVDQLLLAVKGSGQGLYIGLANDCYLVASEVYGLVGLTNRYVRLDGSTAAAGTLVTIDRAGAGTLSGLRRYRDGAEPVAEAEVCTAEITTRDITRGSFDHYLLKEITEAPASFHKSLRGRITSANGQLAVSLSESMLPQALRGRFASGEIRELIFIGQGTAAVACRGIAAIVKQLLHTTIAVDAMPATELSAWELRPDMSSTCLVAVSQSGSTTDTNRAVDMARSRGAAVLCVVNRRESDLAHKCDGVLYTSDGRDVEMAVASTKAFYSQAATGALLGLCLARVVDRMSPELEDSLLRALLEMPRHLKAVQALGPQIAEVAQVAMRYPYWAVVGSGPNRVAADESRIKLSELCYKTISSDAVEDKKHIDLSAEALVLVCAAGAPVDQLRDLTKEVDIFSAHRNAAVVIIDEGVDLAWATDRIIQVPASHPAFAWILSTAAGHLFAYHAARAIDGRAQPLREALEALETSVDLDRTGLDDLNQAVEGLHRFVAEAAEGQVRGVLGSDTAIRLCYASLLVRHGASAIAALPTGAAEPVEFVREQLTLAIEELTRSIDSVKHQAKTVTVGTSRGDADLLDNPLTAALAEAGGDPRVVSYSTVLALRAYARLVERVEGVTRYQIGADTSPRTIQVTVKLGSAQTLTSRADRGAELSGNKRLAVQSGTVRLVHGARDGRLVLLVPEQIGSRAHALTLLHIVLRTSADPADLIEALELTGTRLDEIRAGVTETDSPFDPTSLAQLPTETVLLAPIPNIVTAITGSE